MPQNSQDKIQIEEVNNLSYEVGKRAGIATIVLTLRQIINQTLFVIGNIILARLLSPSDFGTYAILLFTINTSQIFCDIGLTFTLIRQRNVPLQIDYQSVYSFQLVLTIFTIFVLFLLAPLISSFYKISILHLYVKIIGINLIFICIQTIHSTMVERELKFEKLAIVEIVQNLCFYTVSIILAFQKFGVWSFVIGLFLKHFIGALSICLLTKKFIIPNWNFKLLKSRFKQGLLFQGSSFINIVKDSISPLYIGKILGTSAVGFVNWANTLAFYPILLLNIFNRVYLPSFSRMQDNQNVLKTFFEIVIGWTNRITVPLVCILFLFVNPITKLIYSENWLPAEILVKIFCISNLLIATSGPTYSLLNSLGFTSLTFRMSLMWCIINWVFGVPLIYFFGMNGYGITNIIVTLTNLIMFYYCKKAINVSFVKPIFISWFNGFLIIAIFYFFGKIFPVTNFLNLFFNIICILFLYCFLSVIFEFKTMKKDFNLFLRTGKQTL